MLSEISNKTTSWGVVIILLVFGFIVMAILKDDKDTVKNNSHGINAAKQLGNTMSDKTKMEAVFMPLCLQDIAQSDPMMYGNAGMQKCKERFDKEFKAGRLKLQ